MFGLLESEIIFYSGIAIMGIAVLCAVAGILIFTYTGRKLQSRLEEEYGKLPKYKK